MFRWIDSVGGYVNVCKSRIRKSRLIRTMLYRQSGDTGGRVPTLLAHWRENCDSLASPLRSSVTWHSARTRECDFVAVFQCSRMLTDGFVCRIASLFNQLSSRFLKKATTRCGQSTFYTCYFELSVPATPDSLRCSRKGRRSPRTARVRMLSSWD